MVFFGHFVIQTVSQAGTDLKMTSQPWKEACRTVGTDGFLRTMSMRSSFSGHRGHFVQFPASTSSIDEKLSTVSENITGEHRKTWILSRPVQEPTDCPLASWKSSSDQPPAFLPPCPSFASIQCTLSPESQEIAFWSIQSTSFSAHHGFENQPSHSVAVWPERITSLDFGFLTCTWRISPSLPTGYKD